MMVSPNEQFAAVLAETKRCTPFGRLLAADHAGLIKRAEALGVPPRQARAMIAEMAKRPRHPVTRGIE